MKKTFFVTVLAILLAAPAWAGGFSLYGSYWDTDAVDETFGGGLAFAFPVSSAIDVELRGAYYEELTSEGFDNLFEGGEPVFEQNGLEVIPLEAGLRWNFNREGGVNPYIGGGLSYYLLDTDFGEVDDEFGYYLAVGSEFGDRQGPAFFVEGNYRKVEGSVENDPNDFRDIDDIEFRDRVDFDLDGLGVNLGVVWRW